MGLWAGTSRNQFFFLQGVRLYVWPMSRKLLLIVFMLCQAGLLEANPFEPQRVYYRHGPTIGVGGMNNEGMNSWFELGYNYTLKYAGYGIYAGYVNYAERNYYYLDLTFAMFSFGPTLHSGDTISQVGLFLGLNIPIPLYYFAIDQEVFAIDFLLQPRFDIAQGRQPDWSLGFMVKFRFLWNQGSVPVQGPGQEKPKEPEGEFI